MDRLDPYSVEDLLKAHGVMMRGLIDEAGEFRSRPVGVVDGEGRIIHFGTLPDYVPGLVTELLGWAKKSRLPMLIKSCVTHYELELHTPVRGRKRKDGAALAHADAVEVEPGFRVASGRINCA